MSKKQLIIAIDFDGTIAEHKYPVIGDPMPGAFEVMKELKEAGHLLILWTCREDDGYKIDRQYLTEAVDFCKENGVEFDSVNETIEECEFRPGNMLKRKPYAHYYVDDAIVGGFPGWEVIREEILGKKEKLDGNQTDETVE